MNWPAIFLGCFVVGFVLSVLSVAFGVVDAHVHFPWETHVHLNVSHAGHLHGLGPINFAKRLQIGIESCPVPSPA